MVLLIGVRRLQILEIMRLIDEDVIDAELVEDKPVILLVAS
jgi:hypothetical protein